jgi:hypothetical protein
MPADPGQTRPARIPLDYFKQTDGVRRWKLILTAVAVAATVVWLLSGLLQSDGGRLRYSRGPVASVHAMWDSQCDACHSSFQPIQSDTWASAIVGTDGDAKCQHCHEGPPHHASATSPACASCHREHQGREASLVQLADFACVQCHGNLPAHGGTLSGSAFAPSIHRFDQDHPEFRITDHFGQSRTEIGKAADPGRLKFNHRLHLTNGMVLDPRGKPFLYKNIADANEGERYARQASKTLDDRVHLNCAACHRLDAEQSGSHPEPIAGLPATSVSPPRAPGATMLPIVYERHCRACHPLTFDDGQAAVPHRLQTSGLRDFLERHYTGQLMKGKPSIFDAKLPARLVPGKSPDPAMEEAMNRIRSQVAAAEKQLYQDKKTCGECHYYEKTESRRIVSPDVPTIWLPHASFSHLAHRAVDCSSCHPRADESTEAKEILLPGIEVCKQCHAPAGRNAGGARNNCTECHRYHNGDNPLQGIGAEERQPRKTSLVDDLLGRPLH